MTIFAKLDVTIWSHERVLAAGPAAFGLWSACLAYLRQHESSDGHVKPHVIGQFFGLGKQEATALCEHLVDVGLFERHPEGGYILLRYAEHNETKEEIEERRKATRERVEAHRQKKQNQDGNGPSNDTGNALPTQQQQERNASGNESVPDSDFVSVSVGSDPSPDLDPTTPVAGSTEPADRPLKAADDGAFGMAVAAWCEGVSSVTGAPFFLGRGSPTEALVGAMSRHCTSVEGRIEWARTKGAEYASERTAKRQRITAYDFGDWLNSQLPEPPPKPKPPRSATEPEEPGVPCPPEVREAFRSHLAATARPLADWRALRSDALAKTAAEANAATRLPHDAPDEGEAASGASAAIDSSGANVGAAGA